MADDEALAGTSASSGCVAPDVAEAALERVLTSRTFAGTPVLQRLLRHLVRSAMRGEPPGATKEYVLGVEVFNRDSTFDPRTDTIVRAHARRLRTRLNEYYQTEGRDDPVRIDLPKGSYVAIFRERDACVCGESQSAVHPTAANPSGWRRDWPVPRTSLIGRESDLDATRALLGRGEVRLVTLTGAGGSGKTRLAIDIIASVAPSFRGSVAWVALASFSDESAAAREIARALGLRQGDSRPLIDVLPEHVRQTVEERSLVVLDNVEHLPGLVTLLVALLEATQHLTLLVTSRSRLRISGEHVYTVVPLAVPALEGPLNAETVGGNPAVALFVERAKASDPTFALSDDNARAIAEVCVRLDGLPLALELAAARSAVLTPSQIRARLDACLDLFRDVAADRPPRQRTLRHTLEWSHGLLPAAEQPLFRRLAVFSGGWTLEAAEAVCNTRRDLEVPVLDGLASLVDSSLVQPMEDSASERRFLMLETVRAFAFERLHESGEYETVARAHAAYGLVVAEEVAWRQTPVQLSEWLAWCDRERANLESALAYLLARGNADWALRLGVALYRYWESREYMAAARAALESILRLEGTADHPVALARALTYCGALASVQGDHDAAARHQRVSLDVYRRLGDPRGIIAQLNSLAATERWRGNPAGALEWAEQTLTACHELNDEAATAAALLNLGRILLLGGRHQDARRQVESAAERFEKAGCTIEMAWCRNHLGDIAFAEDDLAAARAHYEAGARLFRDQDHRWGIARSACDLGQLSCAEGDYAQGQALFADALLGFRSLGYKRGMASAVDGLARVCSDLGDVDRALLLAGAAAGIRETAGAVPRWEQDQKIEPVRVSAMERCDAELARRLWDEGRRLPLERAVAVALKKAVPGSSQGNWPDPRGDVPPRPDRPAGRPVVRARR